ncbi:hypothetical protein HKCCE3408_16820, partial [Rhodobacterales bacterium HKCCE3408]|nr:hypothetical protein [Rhodobacterales bacterium HKCCE3408]
SAAALRPSILLPLLLAGATVAALVAFRHRNRRRAERFSYSGPAVLSVPGSAPAPARFFDISCSGARLIVAADLAPEMRVEIGFADRTVPARVVWAKGQMAGFAFDAPLRPADLRDLLAA